MPVLTSSIRPGRLLALLGAIIAVTCVLPALAGAQESGDGPPFSFPGCTEQTDGTVDCGYSGSEDDVPPNCSRPDEGGQLTCYPGGIYADGSDPELSAPGGDCVDPGPCDDSSEPTGEECPPGQEDENGVCPDAAESTPETENQASSGVADGEGDDSGGGDGSSSGDGQGVSDSSASATGGDDEGSAAGSSEAGVESVQLARTGSDSWLLFLIGTTLTIAALALRTLSARRSVDA